MMESGFNVHAMCATDLGREDMDRGERENGQKGEKKKLEKNWW